MKTASLSVDSRPANRSPRSRTARSLLLSLLTCHFLATPRLAAQEAPGFEEIFGARLQLVMLDTDDDGILDERELLLGTDRELADTDGDGFSDLFEDVHRDLGFDPLTRSKDTDGDGLTDSLERVLKTSFSKVDSDDDGWTDLDEVINSAYGYHPLKPTLDRDFDGLADDLEQELGCSSETSDTDGDGGTDFEEYAAGLDPRVFNEGGFGELIGRTYSDAMEETILHMRKGGAFPAELAGELPYPAVMSRLFLKPSGPAGGGGPTLSVSAALLQQALYWPLFNPYYSYDGYVAQLQQIAQTYDGSPKPRIVRLFRWSQPTFRGRFIYAMKISDNPHLNETEKEVLFMGVHHARELITSSITLGLINKLTDQYGDPLIKHIVDTTEVWIIPMVNPDGYARALGEREIGAKVDWRKNDRKATELQIRIGVDLNRNYGFEHLTSFSFAQRAGLSGTAKWANGLYDSGEFNPDSDTFGERFFPFSEVETRAVKGLVDNAFLTGSEVNRIGCSLSWHSFGGEVIYPMGHPSANGLVPAHRPRFDAVSDAFAVATGYANTRDNWPALHYPVYGDSDDWLYKAKGITAITVESYSSSERGGAGPLFFPETVSKRNEVVANNMNGALAMIDACCGSCPSILVAVAVINNTLMLVFPTEAGAVYSVEFAASLSEPDWNVLQRLDGTGEEARVRDPISADHPGRFYRVVRVN